MQDTIRARRLEICNASGGCVMSLDTWQDGAPYLRIYDRNGCERLVLSLNAKDEPQISFLKEGGETMIGIGIREDLGSGFSISDSSGNIRILAVVDPKGSVEFREVPK